MGRSPNYYRGVSHGFFYVDFPPGSHGLIETLTPGILPDKDCVAKQLGVPEVLSGGNRTHSTVRSAFSFVFVVPYKHNFGPIWQTFFSLQNSSLSIQGNFFGRHIPIIGNYQLSHYYRLPQYWEYYPSKFGPYTPQFVRTFFKRCWPLAREHHLHPVMLPFIMCLLFKANYNWICRHKKTYLHPFWHLAGNDHGNIQSWSIVPFCAGFKTTNGFHFFYF